MAWKFLLHNFSQSLFVAFCVRSIRADEEVSGRTVVYENVTEDSLSVTSCLSDFFYEIEIFETTLTRFQADESCRQNGYDGLVTFEPYNCRIAHVQRHLLQNGHSASEILHYWTDFFRASPNNSTWFTKTSNGRCVARSGTYTPAQYDEIQQCAILKFSFREDPALVARRCPDRFPYICAKKTGPLIFDIFEGFSVTRKQSNITTTIIQSSNLTHCNEICANSSSVKEHCAALMYQGLNCTLYMLDPAFGQGTFVINRTSKKNITFAMKAGSSVISYRNGTYTCQPEVLPTCEVSNLTTDDCRCSATPWNNDTLFEEMFDELLENLTLDPHATGRTKRRYECADDVRMSAKAYGLVAAAFIASVLCLPVLSDIMTFREKLERRRKRKAKRRERKRSRLTENIAVLENLE